LRLAKNSARRGTGTVMPFGVSSVLDFLGIGLQG
jgi:hypothetical protein